MKGRFYPNKRNTRIKLLLLLLDVMILIVAITCDGLVRFVAIVAFIIVLIHLWFRDSIRWTRFFSGEK